MCLLYLLSKYHLWRMSYIKNICQQLWRISIFNQPPIVSFRDCLIHRNLIRWKKTELHLNVSQLSSVCPIFFQFCNWTFCFIRPSNTNCLISRASLTLKKLLQNNKFVFLQYIIKKYVFPVTSLRILLYSHLMKSIL